jgi:transposase
MVYNAMPRKDLEKRRLAAVDLLKTEMSDREIAREMGVSGTTVGRWRHALESGSDMRARKGTGRPPKMSANERVTFISLFNDIEAERGRVKNAYFVKCFEDMTGIRFHRDHVYKLFLQFCLIEKKRKKFNV